MFKQFISNVIIYMLGLKSAIFLFVFYLSHLFFVPLLYVFLLSFVLTFY